MANRLPRIGALLAALVLALVATFASTSTASAESGLSSPFFGNHAGGKRGPWAVMIFGGQLTENELADIIIPKSDKGSRFTDTSFIGGALSKEIFRYEGLSVELEGGLGYQFGDFQGVDNSAAHVWGAAYFRYDDFPWNHIVHTSVAGSIGLNYISDRTALENDQTKGGDGRTVKVLHYFSPEITFSHPDYLQHELVFRVHHRSSASGVFGCNGCGSNIVTVGYRHRF
ncbi:MAG: hypothetical protein OXR62_04630 [Ahrensia sp.]|nr:hypothetical protein [Ahrensia sp.]